MEKILLLFNKFFPIIDICLHCGHAVTETHNIDTELVSRIIINLKRGKAMNIDGLTAEHLQYCHSVLPVLLKKLFHLMISCSFVPDGFRYRA